MLPDLERHDMLWLTDAARQRIAGQIALCGSADAMAMAAIFARETIPAIVRRSVPGDGEAIGVGISFPLRGADGRLRFSAAVSEAEISAICSPYAAFDAALTSGPPPLRALAQVRRTLAQWQGRLGVYGACALQILTGLDYLHAESDLDLVLDGGSAASLLAAQRTLRAIGDAAGVRIDAEVMVGGGRAVKLCELVGEQQCVLAKSIHSVELLARRDVLHSLASPLPMEP